MPRLRVLRMVVIVVPVLLAFPFELGMSLNLSPRIEDIPGFGITPAAIWKALARVGGDALTHAVLAAVLVALGLAELVLGLISGAGSVAVMASLSFLALALAAINGTLFTASGFSNDGYSHGMATGFLLAFSFHFILVSILFVKLRRGSSRDSTPRDFTRL